MSLELYSLFILASVLLIATPGPNVALIVGASLAHGHRPGLMTVAGVNSGLVLQLVALAGGLSWVVELFSRHFDLIRYAGAAYLAVLGIQQLASAASAREDCEANVMLSSERAFARGFAVAFANPKTLIFHAAFLPQFLSGAEGSGGELWLLVATFAAVAAVGDTMWALAAAKARAAVSGRARWLADRISGGLLLGGAVALLAARRSA